MKRKIYDVLLDWKNKSGGTSALMLDGARRVGKSYIAEEFARNEYENYLLIDFAVATKEVKRYFEDYLSDLDTFFMYLQAAYNVELPRRKSVIIFDEVQRFPRAREAIKYLVADGRYDYIETGSLISIGRNVKNIVIPSEEHHVKMFPMDFEEFLWATGNEAKWPIVCQTYERRQKVEAGLHRWTMDVFRQYMIVGGMPQVVKKFVATHDLRAVDAEKRDILELYRADIMKFGGASRHKILAIFNAIPGELQHHAKVFSPGAVRKGAGMRTFESAFQWLASAMTVNLAYNATEPNLGLELSSDHHALKCYLADTGLFVSMAFSENELLSGEVQQRILTGRLEGNFGMIWETVVAQMLRAAGHQLFFYMSNDATNAANRMEIDFLVAKATLQRRHNVAPIEVKGTGEYATKSLDKFMRKYDAFLDEGVVVHEKNLERGERRLSIPVYMTPLLQVPTRG